MFGRTEQRKSRREWEASIGAEAAVVTLDELAASELMHVCQRLAMLEDCLRYVLLNAAAIDGRLNRIETYLAAHDARYPTDDGQKDRLAQAVLARGDSDTLKGAAQRPVAGQEAALTAPDGAGAA